MTVPRTCFPGPFLVDIPAPGFDGGKSFSQNIAVATRWTIINSAIFWQAWLIRKIRHVLWRSDWIFQYQVHFPSCTCNLGIYQDHSFLHVAVQIRYQHLYMWFWNHVAVIAVGRGKILSWCWACLESRECPLFVLLQGFCEQSGSWIM